MAGTKPHLFFNVEKNYINASCDIGGHSYQLLSWHPRQRRKHQWQATMTASPTQARLIYYNLIYYNQIMSFI
ncbi:MAG: hypothetical protein LBG97_05645 [Coriobacteriales bacterium]|nr:hypothetical protein [Coriobacteriales bacterium]